MAANYSSILVVLVIFLFTSLSNSSLTHSSGNGGGGGFSVDFIHRDSHRSPFYNPLETNYDRLKRAISRSTSRLNHFKASSPPGSSTETAKAKVISDGGEYLMNISIGTPPAQQLVIADTGSDLIWVQCLPCDNYCYRQDLPYFDSTNSTSYKFLTCNSKPCAALPQRTCGRESLCQYSYSYGDSSYTRGELATETFTFDSTTRRPIQIPKIAFGCGHDNGGTFSRSGSGLVGLGGGSLSLISQMGDQIGGKFSYCLAPLSSSNESSGASTLNFGSKGVVSGPGVVSTPLISSDPATFYYLTLEGVSVGNNKKIAYKRTMAAGSGNEEGNIIIDSGTTLTYLPSEMYNEVESQVSSAIDLEPVEGPAGLKLCYRTESGTDLGFPTITAHFSGADVVLNPVNTFVGVEEGLVCLAFVPAGNLAIFGNLAQMNYLVGYDLQAGTVSFKPTDCSEN